MGIGDKRITDGQANICWVKPRDKHDLIVVQEKLDGSCVCVARLNGQLLAITRAGYEASTSKYIQHHYFKSWVEDNAKRFEFLKEGERVIGEWLAQAHATKYELKHVPFVVFDLARGKRVSRSEFKERITDLPTPHEFSCGGPFSREEMNAVLAGPSFHGGEKIEGVMYRVYRKDEIDYLAKCVRDDHNPGSYLPEISGCTEEVWNWKPGNKP